MAEGGADVGSVVAPADGGLALAATSPDSDCTSAMPPAMYNAMGQGTRAAPYVLCTVGQLMNLAATPAAWKYSYRLGADIDLGSNGSTSSSPFPMIGTTSRPFNGTFDGGRHLISNLDLSLPKATGVGFFGCIQGSAAEVRSLNIAKANVVGYEDVGILAGEVNDGARILGSATEGAVQANNQVGGLVGFGFAGTVISSSRSSATVTAASSNAGGLAGELSTGPFVFNSFAIGAVNGGSGTGGLVGDFAAGGVYDSYSTAAVASTSTSADGVAGFIGTAGGATVLNCFSTGTVTAAAASKVNQFIGDSPFGTYTNNFVSNAAPCQRASAACPAETHATAVVPTQLQSSAEAPLSAWDFMHTWTPPSGGFPTLDSTLFDPTTWDGCSAHASDVPVAGGDGTPDRPYLVCSAAQFAQLAATSSLHSGVAILQMGAIDFSSAPTLQPIGTTDSPFIGVYDGNGKTLSNFKVSGSSGPVGLFGDASGLIVRVAAVDGMVVGGAKSTAAGMVAGYLYGTLLDSYCVGGSVIGPMAVGGLGNAHTTGFSYASTTVTATGGIAGGLTAAGGPDGVVYDTFSSSNVTATGGTAYDLTPTVSSSGQVSDSYFDSSKCSGCTNVDAMGESTTYFYDVGNTPMSKWDFDDIWMANPGAFPTLR